MKKVLAVLLTLVITNSVLAADLECTRTKLIGDEETRAASLGELITIDFVEGGVIMNSDRGEEFLRDSGEIRYTDLRGKKYSHVASARLSIGFGETFGKVRYSGKGPSSCTYFCGKGEGEADYTCI